MSLTLKGIVRQSMSLSRGMGKREQSHEGPWQRRYCYGERKAKCLSAHTSCLAAKQGLWPSGLDPLIGASVSAWWRYI